ncbi:MAG TPA: hypothetical protein V6C78_34740 [Crinalium sp.]|jgi:hypothetical protein
MATSKLSSDLLVSLATAPLLVVLVGSKVLAELMQNLGQSSEEVFRGDRLPVLNIPATGDSSQEQG